MIFSCPRWWVKICIISVACVGGCFLSDVNTLACRPLLPLHWTRNTFVILNTDFCLVLESTLHANHVYRKTFKIHRKNSESCPSQAELNLQFCNYAPKWRICRENRKYAPDDEELGILVSFLSSFRNLFDPQTQRWLSLVSDGLTSVFVFLSSFRNLSSAQKKNCLFVFLSFSRNLLTSD